MASGPRRGKRNEVPFFGPSTKLVCLAHDHELFPRALHGSFPASTRGSLLWLATAGCAATHAESCWVGKVDIPSFSH